MNGYQVNDDWIKHFQEQRRKQAKEHYTSLVKESAARINAAYDWVVRALPDLADDEQGVDPFAVLAAMRLKAETPDRPVTVAMVRAWLVKHAKERHRRGYINAQELEERLVEIGA